MSKKRHLEGARRAITAIASCALFVVALEGSLGALQRFSFPYLPLFVKDAALGVALAPDATARVRTRGGHITTVRTDGEGARIVPTTSSEGPSLLVVGDSQAMGLHVDDDETFAALLARGGRRVRVRAVPSYGPLEYADLVDAHARPGDDVFVLFAPSNDFFEARVPNVRRTTARLGFVARVSPGEAPSLLDDVPAIFGRSHAVYALRMLLGRAAKDAHVADVTHLFETAGDRLATPSSGDPHASRLGPVVGRIAARCQAIGCRVSAAVLPLDVESDARAFEKVARAADRALVLDVAARLRAGAHDDLRAAGVAVVDLTETLAFEGAFLHDDDHLSPRGHAALARSLAGALDARLAVFSKEEAQ